MSKIVYILDDATGISLVEMMIAMLVGMILLISLNRVFFSTTTSYDFESEMSNLQENGRFSLDFLTRDVRMAGYRGCAGAKTSLINTLKNSSNFLYNFTRAIEGYDDVAPPPPTDLSGAGIAPLAGTDVLVLRMQDGDGVLGVVRQKDSPTADLKISNTDNPAIQDKDIVIVTDCESATVFQVSQVNSGGASHAELIHNMNATDTPGNATKDLGHSYEQGGEIVRMVTMAYFIATNADGVPGLYYKRNSDLAQEIVSGVENMQVTYGVDTNGNQAIDSFVSSGGVADWGDVLAVRIGLLVASANEVPRGEIDSTAYVVNGTDVPAANDRRLRQVFVSTVALRNRVP
jgi:type IV pilus assembly protein PilW